MKPVLRLLALAQLAGLALQFYFAGRIALMRVVNPESTAFQRSQLYRVGNPGGTLKWRQQWAPYADISAHLKRAIIASEDASFIGHDGVDLQALEAAWEKNSKAEARAAQSPVGAATSPSSQPIKIFGGSTITQQLAKNLFLSGERNLLRKGQELLLTLMLESLLSKRRIFEIYLNSVEWGEGVFGAEAAARHYFRKPASQLTAYEAARLAVMLPRPRYFETRLQSAYLASRARTIAAHMSGIQLP